MFYKLFCQSLSLTHRRAAEVKYPRFGQSWENGTQMIILNYIAAGLLKINSRIRCTSWFNAGSSIIDNNLRGAFFPNFKPLRGTLTLWGPILFPFLNLRGKANLYLT